jgi:hypothetical protein
MRNFKTQELVPQAIYNQRKDMAIQLMDSRIIRFIDTLRDKLGKPIVINDWCFGGKNHQRGLRTESSTYYKRFSQHTYGRALDFNVVGMDSDDVRQYILEHRNEDWCKDIMFMETGISWVHVDCRYTPNNEIILWDLLTGRTTVYGRS